MIQSSFFNSSFLHVYDSRFGAANLLERDEVARVISEEYLLQRLLAQVLLQVHEHLFLVDGLLHDLEDVALLSELLIVNVRVRSHSKNLRLLNVLVLFASDDLLVELVDFLG